MVYLNEHINLMKMDSIWLLSNFDNQAVIGLDSNGVEFWNDIKSGTVTEEKIEKNRDFYDSLWELEFLSEKKKEHVKKFHITSAYVHLLNRCNLSCLGCYSMNTERNIESDATTEMWKLAFSRLSKAGVRSIVISGGEPLLRNDLVELLRYAKNEIGIENITLITNGTIDFPFVKIKEFVDVVAVSVDGYDEIHASFLRNEGIFDKIIYTVKQIREEGIQVCIVPTIHMKNYAHMQMYDQLAERLKVSINFSILSVPCNETFKDFVLEGEALNTIAKDIIDLNIEVQDVSTKRDMLTAGEGLCAMKTCGFGQDMISVDSKGNIYPCHILHDESLLIGNIFEKSLDIENLNPYVLAQCEKANVDNIEGCKDCQYRYLCGGGCRGRAFLKEKNIYAKDTYCNLFHKFHEIEMNMIKQGLGNEE